MHPQMAGWNHKKRGNTIFLPYFVVVLLLLCHFQSSLSSFDVSALAVVQVKLLWQHKCSNVCHNTTEREYRVRRVIVTHTHFHS